MLLIKFWPEITGFFTNTVFPWLVALPGKVMEFAGKVWNFLKDAAVNAKEYADIITSPDAMKKLRQLRQLSPTSAKFVAGLSQLGTQYGIIGQEPMSESDLQIMQEQ
jgi:hypothetical protein